MTHEVNLGEVQGRYRMKFTIIEEKKMDGEVVEEYQEIRNKLMEVFFIKL